MSLPKEEQIKWLLEQNWQDLVTSSRHREAMFSKCSTLDEETAHTHSFVTALCQAIERSRHQRVRWFPFPDLTKDDYELEEAGSFRRKKIPRSTGEAREKMWREMEACAEVNVSLSSFYQSPSK